MNKMLHDGLCIATSAYENYSTLQDFFDSLKKQTDINFHVFLTDVTPKPQRIVAPSFCTVLTAQNRGYAYSVNNGVREGVREGYHTYCIVNNDVIFPSDFVAKVKQSTRNNKQSLIGGKIYYAPGYEYHKDRYLKKQKGKVLWYAGGSIDYDHAWSVHKGVDEVDNGQFDTPETITFVTGCLMCFDKNLIDKISLMDESFFLYYEDADYCARALKEGVPMIYDPRIRLWHKNSQSTGGSGSLLHQKYQRKNRLIFALRHAPLRTKLHVIKNYFLGK